MRQDTLTIRHITSEEGGFMLMDALVAIIISAIVALGVTQSALIAYRYSHQAEARAVARELAVERLEEYAAVDPESFTDGNQIIETGLSRSGITFTRTTDFSIESDRARLVVVTLVTTRTKIPVTVEISRAFTLWGER